MLIPYFSFSSRISSSIGMISFYILSARFFLKHEGLSGARVASITRNEYGFCSTFFVKIHKKKSISNEWIRCTMLKFIFVWNFRNKIVRRI